MHVPESNLPRYRRLMALAWLLDRIGNRRSGRGDYAGANNAWARRGRVADVAQGLRVPGRTR